MVEVEGTESRERGRAMKIDLGRMTEIEVEALVMEALDTLSEPALIRVIKHALAGSALPIEEFIVEEHE